MFYLSKTLLFEVMDGLESSLFGVVFRAQFLAVIFCIFFCISGHLGCPRPPKGSPGEILKSQIRVKFEALVPRGSQGWFRGAKLTYFGGHLGVLWVTFLVSF